MIMPEAKWSDQQIQNLTKRIGIRFSPVLGDYMTEGFAACPTCNNHVISRCDGPVNGGRIIVLTIRCPGCDNLVEREFLEISIGRAVPCFRRESRY
jgi:hypothetical protein